MKNLKRSRIALVSWLTIVIILGLASRTSLASGLPWLQNHAGDALWALMVYIGIAFLLPRTGILPIALLAVFFCLAIETSQLFDTKWLASMRSTRIGALVLGHGFLWIDIVRYSIGIVTGLLLDHFWFQKRRS